MQKCLLALSVVLMLAGCSKKDTDQAAKAVVYETYYRTLEDTTSFTDGSEYYTISTEMASLPDGTYRYYIIVDEPKVAMYDVVMLAIEEGVLYDSSDKMMPSIGIYDSVNSMIPGQVNSSAGFVKGMVISGECTDPEVDLRLLVEWKDKTKEKSTREFITLHIPEEESAPEEEPAGEEEQPAEEGNGEG